MARRSDERDAARAEYIARMEKDGEVNLQQLADDLHLKYDTVRRWKAKDVWGPPAPRKPGGQPGNKNAVGNPGGGAPVGNENAMKDGAYATIFFDKLTPEEKQIVENAPRNSTELTSHEIGVLLLREKYILDKIKEYQALPPDQMITSSVMDAHFSFACNGCGDCCRGREDIVLSGFDLWRIAARLRLPPQIVARGYCRASIGTVSHLPVLRLAPVKENRNNCPFLTGDHCAIHDAEPLVCALYPLAQEISRKGQVSYFLQPTGCGGQMIEARVEDYLARYDVPAREQTDVRWAQTCMTLEDTVEQLGAQLSPVLVRRMQDKLWQALYFGYNYAAPFLPQLEKNLHWLDAEFAKLAEYQQKRNNASK